MNDNANKTSICSIVALDLIDYAKKTSAEKLEIKRLFNGFIQNAVLDIPESDRNIIDTADGAAIACKGALEDALEDALFISITIRDEILKHNQQSATPLYVQFGIHLGAARALNDHIVGEGVDEAQRIMRFANPNQILVSNVYFEMASKLTQEIAQMFEKYEMHAHEHDVYAVRLLKEGMADDAAPASADGTVAASSIASSLNWTYVGLGLLSLAAFLMLAKLVMNPVEPTITLVQPEQIQPTPAPAAIKPEAPVAEVDNQEPTLPAAEETIVETKLETKVEPEPAVAASKQVKKPTPKPTLKADVEKSTADFNKAKPAKTAEEKAPTTKSGKPSETKSAETKPEKETTKQAAKEVQKEKSGWQTFKDSVITGADRKCTQAEIALNQCSK